MTSDIQIRLLEVVGASLRPLVRMLLRSGISYRQFDEIAKLAFVKESLASGAQPRVRTNVSRIAVRTGLSRKEVARIRDLIDSTGDAVPSRSGAGFHTNQAARVLQIWHSDRRFLGEDGRPKELVFDTAELSFAHIVKLVGGDVPAGAVRAELLSAGAIEELKDGRLRVLKRHFIPGDLGEEMVVGFRHIVNPLLGALAHNCSVDKQDAFLQRVAYSDSMSVAAIEDFRRHATELATVFIHSIDDWLGGHEDKLYSPPQHRARVGVGVFYFEEELPRSKSKE